MTDEGDRGIKKSDKFGEKRHIGLWAVEHRFAIQPQCGSVPPGMDNRLRKKRE
jgi:hypothetical protein